MKNITDEKESEPHLMGVIGVVVIIMFLIVLGITLASVKKDKLYLDKMCPDQTKLSDTNLVSLEKRIYQIECDGIVQEGTFFQVKLSSKCIEYNKWGRCTDKESDRQVSNCLTEGCD